MMVCVAKQKSPPKAKRRTITVTVNELLMDRLDAIADSSGRNRSEMLDRVIEFFLDSSPQANAGGKSGR